MTATTGVSATTDAFRLLTALTKRAMTCDALAAGHVGGKGKEASQMTDRASLEVSSERLRGEEQRTKKGEEAPALVLTNMPEAGGGRERVEEREREREASRRLR